MCGSEFLSKEKVELCLGFCVWFAVLHFSVVETCGVIVNVSFDAHDKATPRRFTCRCTAAHICLNRKKRVVSGHVPTCCEVYDSVR